MTRLICATALALSVSGCALSSLISRIPDGVLYTLCALAQPVKGTGEAGVTDLRLLAAVSGVLCEDARASGTLREIIVPKEHAAALEVARLLQQGQEFYADGRPREGGANQSLAAGDDVCQSLTVLSISEKDQVRKLNRMDPPVSMRSPKTSRWWVPWRRNNP